MDIDTVTKHKFLKDSNMTFQEVFGFAYRRLIPILQDLTKELGEEQVLEVLEKVALDSGLRAGQAYAGQLPCNDLATFKTWATEPNYFWKHVLTFEIIEDKIKVFEVRVTECLWAKTYQEIGATDIGYLLHCNPDYTYCQGFNPQITMIRSKTLMQGDNHCNHRWICSA
jgi:hypothetical protein